MLLEPFIIFFKAFFSDAVSDELIYCMGLMFVYFICIIFAEKILSLLQRDTKHARKWIWIISGTVMLLYILNYLNLVPLGINLGGVN